MASLGEEPNPWTSTKLSSVQQYDLPDQPILCADCPEQSRRPATSSCPKCNRVYCDDCWAYPAPHSRGDHEPVQIHRSQIEDIPVFPRLRQVFKKAAEQDQQHQHQNDLETLWLAVSRPGDTHGSLLTFHERPRFGYVIDEHQRQVWQQSGDTSLTCYPRMISFLGNTGAGKSSLIEVLIGHLWDSRITNGDLHGTLVPVVGNNNSVPTSSDIHLYRDPIEARTAPESPLLFADCEGLGAANLSAAADSMAKSMKDMEKEAPDDIRQDAMKLHEWTMSAFDTTMQFMKRTINWLDPNSDRKRAVNKLFPRIVYNISDVIVYIVAEPKSVGEVLEKLVKWSQGAEISSVNRTSLPSLIILINKCEAAETEYWSSDKATVQILDENQGLMRHSNVIKSRKDQLQRFGLPHKSIKDILDNSYAAVRFLRLPNANDTPRMSSQLQELHTMISSLTETAHHCRKKDNMLLSPDQLHHLYKLTFDHFTKSAEKPFDFMEAYFAIHPSPAEFSGNFFQLLQATFEAVKRGQQESSHDFAAKLTNAAVPVICSTIAMDIRRRQIPGKLVDIFRGDTSELPSRNVKVRDHYYEKAIENALDEFAGSTLPCGYVFTEPHSEEKKLCVNGRKAHGDNRRGRHQDSSGVHIGSGPFDSSFEYGFRGLWGWNLASQLNLLKDVKPHELCGLHREAIRTLHDLVPDVNLGRLPSCVWCMINFPTERLNCGHWICSSCVVEFGRRSDDDDRVFIVECCDQHPRGGKKLDPPLEFLDLPKTVGKRLLCLDEGGVRGILQLDILAAIQHKLGEEIPVQDCFDLIGGTGIGGIIALGLGISGWSVPRAIEKFTRLVPQTFGGEGGFNIPGLLWRRLGFYSQSNLDQSIRDAFGEDSKRPMAKSLPQGTESGGGPTRVFVTSTRVLSGGMLLTNYLGRGIDTKQDQNQGLKQSQNSQIGYQCTQSYSIGEAAMATACFHRFFGPCQPNPGEGLHVGGAQYFACPAEATLLEAQSLWPHVSNGGLDVLVSVGCGHQAPAGSGNSNYCTGTGAMWNDAFRESSQQEPDRYIRLCPEFQNDSSLPKADEVSALINGSLRDVTSALREHDQGQTQSQDDLPGRVDQVARRLISTIFYFQKTSSKLCKDGGIIVSGHIRCRFKQNTKIAKAFGRKISDFTNPRFVLGSGDLLWSFDNNVLKDMKEKGRFRAPHIPHSFEIRIPSENHIDVRFVADNFSSESITADKASQISS